MLVAISTKISADSQSIYWTTLGRYLDRHLGRYVDRHISRVLVNMSTDILGECRSIYRRIHLSTGAQNTHDLLNIMKDKLIEGNSNTEHMVFGLRFIKKISLRAIIIFQVKQGLSLGCKVQTPARTSASILCFAKLLTMFKSPSQSLGDHWFVVFEWSLELVRKVLFHCQRFVKMFRWYL